MYKGQKIVAIIPARANSKRCPGKNCRLINGKPMVSWTIESAINSKLLDKIIVTSDDPNVLEIAKKYKDVRAISRPQHLATDEAESLEVVLHALEQVQGEYDYGVLLQPTSPLRLSQDIDNAIVLCGNSMAKTCVSFTSIGKPSSFYYGATKLGLEQLNGYEKIYRANGAVYLFEIKHLLDKKVFSDLSTLPYFMPEDRSVDVDTEEDFATAIRLAGEINDQ